MNAKRYQFDCNERKRFMNGNELMRIINIVSGDKMKHFPFSINRSSHLDWISLSSDPSFHSSILDMNF